MKALLILFAILCCACSRTEPVETKTPKSNPVRITQFYPSQPSVAKGDKAVLCYGVESAAKVRVEPPVAELAPSMTRCFEVTPADTTTYTLVAEGADGSTAKQTATVVVGGRKPSLTDLSISKKSVKAGELVAFCFDGQNASEVTGSPGKMSYTRGRTKGCLTDQPKKTTTYQLTARNAEGLTDSASMTVEVTP